MTIRPGDRVLYTLGATTHTVADVHRKTYGDIGEVLVIETTEGERLRGSECMSVTGHARELHEGARVRHLTDGTNGTVTRAPCKVDGVLAADVTWADGESGAYCLRYLQAVDLEIDGYRWTLAPGGIGYLPA